MIQLVRPTQQNLLAETPPAKKQKRIDDGFPGSVRSHASQESLGDAGDADATVTAKAGGSPALWQLRGLQSTAAFFPSMFRTWAEFRRYVQAQAAFGTNQIEMGGAPVCDANGSIAHTRLVNATLCEASVEGIVNFSRELHQIGMNVSFGQSLAVFTEHKSLMERAWRLMPRVDSIFWPGGDGA